MSLFFKTSLVFVALLLITAGALNAVALTQCTAIHAPGGYTLTQNVTTNGGGAPGGANAPSCIDVNSSNVVLDCQGFSVKSTSNPADVQFGIAINSSNVTVKNCDVRNFNALTGKSIYVFNSTSSIVRNVTIYNTSFFSFAYGIYAQKAANLNLSSLVLNSTIANDIYAIWLSEVFNSTITYVDVNLARPVNTLYGLRFDGANTSISHSNLNVTWSSIFSTSNLTAFNLTLLSDLHAFYQFAANASILLDSTVTSGNLTGSGGVLTVVNSTFSLHNVSGEGAGRVVIQKPINFSMYSASGFPVGRYVPEIFYFQNSSFVYFNGVDVNGEDKFNATVLIYNSTNAPYNFSNFSIIAYVGLAIKNRTSTEVYPLNSSGGYYSFKVIVQTTNEFTNCANITSHGDYGNNYYLVSNVTNNGLTQAACFDLRAANTVLDCRGFWIYPNVTTPSNQVGVLASGLNATVKNCTFTNFNQTTSVAVKAYNSTTNVSNFTLFNSTIYNSAYGVNLTNVNYSNLSNLYFQVVTSSFDSDLIHLGSIYNSTFSYIHAFTNLQGMNARGILSSGTTANVTNLTVEHSNFTLNSSVSNFLVLENSVVASGSYAVNLTLVNVTANLTGDPSVNYLLADFKGAFVKIFNSSLVVNGTSAPEILYLNGNNNLRVYSSTLRGGSFAIRSAVASNLAYLENVTITSGNLSSNNMNVTLYNSSISLSNVSAVTAASSNISFIVPLRVTVTTGGSALGSATVQVVNYSSQSLATDVNGIADFNVTALLYNNTAGSPFNFSNVSISVSKSGYVTNNTFAILTPNESALQSITITLTASSDDSPASPAGGGGGGGGGGGSGAAPSGSGEIKTFEFQSTRVVANYTANKTTFTLTYNNANAIKEGSIELALPINYSKYRNAISVSPSAEIREGSVIVKWSDLRLNAGETFTGKITINQLLSADFATVKNTLAAPVIQLNAVANQRQEARSSENEEKQSKAAKANETISSSQKSIEKKEKTEDKISFNFGNLLLPIAALIVLIVIVLTVLKFGGKRGTTISTSQVEKTQSGIDIPFKPN